MFGKRIKAKDFVRALARNAPGDRGIIHLDRYLEADVVMSELQSLLSISKWREHYDEASSGWSLLGLRYLLGKNGSYESAAPAKSFQWNKTRLSQAPYTWAFLQAIMKEAGTRMGRVAFMKLDPGGYSGYHNDGCLYDENLLRFHVPIVSNPLSAWALNGTEMRPLPVGALTYVDTTLFHEVRNQGREARIHLVFDMEISGGMVELLNRQYNNKLPARKLNGIKSIYFPISLDGSAQYIYAEEGDDTSKLANHFCSTSVAENMQAMCIASVTAGLQTLLNDPAAPTYRMSGFNRVQIGYSDTPSNLDWEHLDHKVALLSNEEKGQQNSRRFDLVTDNLPWPNGTVAHIYASHVIEHIPLRFGYFVLVKLLAKLKPGGTIRLITPDLKAMARAYIDGDSDAFINRDRNYWAKIDDVHMNLGIGGYFMNQIVAWGDDTYLFDRSKKLELGGFSHLAAYDFEMLRKVMEAAGFVNVARGELDEQDEHRQGGQLVVTAEAPGGGMVGTGI
jgi:hypothetical protein